VRSAVPVDDAIRSGSVPAVPVRERDAEGVEEPIPTLPFASIVKSDDPVELATINGFVVDVPCTKRVADSVVVPRRREPLPVIRARSSIDPPDVRVKKERADASEPLVALVRMDAIREVVAVLPDAFSDEKRIPDPIPEAAVPDDDLPIENTSSMELVELSDKEADRAGTPERDDVVDTLKDPAPCERKPPLPTVILVLATIEPFACMSLRTERLPASSEWMMAEVDSRPPRSRMDIEFPLKFATYAYLPEI
jgi:hypothetical protein